MFDWTGLLATIGIAGLGVALLVLGLLSQRLGSVTRAPRYYIGFYLGTLLVGVSVLARLLNIGRGTLAAQELVRDPLWVTLYIGLPAFALTIGVFIAWRYWSWLLAERG
ncbi:MAG: hypothetical protein JNJ61_25935 [Anaerolineae bacterium]|nr:hypothetical protein [Anaerolineae bacterium]